ncbi:MAG TPA: DUF5652 family protein [Candidatus Peribacteraceae bacterium]|nr:DUF5652 family protein [Candidatus Peribacteraceae bacterium]
MDFFNVLSQNKDFMFGAYNLTPVLLGFTALALIDVGLKAWAMWRAARMNKIYWFIGLLLINSLGILPIIFLLITNEQYKQWLPQKTQSPVS